MKKNLTELVFILDRSGSMSGLEADTVGGFNSMLRKQQREEGDVFVSTILFDNVSEVIHDRADIKSVRPMTEKDYVPRGCTALLDAVGDAIQHIGNIHKYAREEDVPEHTLFIITTDGMENASRRHSVGKVKNMIERQKQNTVGNSFFSAQIWMRWKPREHSALRRSVPLPTVPTAGEHA